MTQPDESSVTHEGNHQTHTSESISPPSEASPELPSHQFHQPHQSHQPKHQDHQHHAQHHSQHHQHPHHDHVKAYQKHLDHASARQPLTAEAPTITTKKPDKPKFPYKLILIVLLAAILAGVSVALAIRGAVTAYNSFRVKQRTAEIVLSQVSFSPRETIFKRLELGDDTDGHHFEFFTVGQVDQAPYRKAQVILALITVQGPCKGSTCDLPVFERYLYDGEKLTFLPKASDTVKSVLTQYPDAHMHLGLEIGSDPRISLTTFDSPATILVPETENIELSLVGQIDQEINPDQVELAFEHELGQVWTTKATASSNQSFYLDDQLPLGPFGRLCPGERCFLAHGFYLGRPDGTTLVYRYRPAQASPYADTVTIAGEEYKFSTHIGCSSASVDFISVAYPAVSLVGGRQVAKLGELQTAVVVASSQDPMISEFYLQYQEMIADQLYQSMGVAELSLEEFVALDPLLYWTDPLGRQIRLTRQELLPPMACEPIVYLYSPEPQDFNLSLDPQVRVFASQPNYTGSWSVRADAGGRLTNLSDGSIHDYIFWEGFSGMLPRSQAAQVLEAGEVETYLDEALPALGLVGREVEDFKNAWLGKLTLSPYVAISFYDQTVIDQLYPLSLQPPAETIIRVLMDYQPLERFEVRPQVAPPVAPPVRSGVVLVEWGGLVR